VLCPGGARHACCTGRGAQRCASRPRRAGGRGVTDTGVVQVSATVRYDMVTQCLERLWGFVGAERPADDGEPLLYDGLLQQLEDRMMRVHRLMLELGVSTLPPAGPRASGGAVSRASFGFVTYIPCQVSSRSGNT